MKKEFILINKILKIMEENPSPADTITKLADMISHREGLLMKENDRLLEQINKQGIEINRLVLEKAELELKMATLEALINMK